jgi:hypothetical protein
MMSLSRNDVPLHRKRQLSPSGSNKNASQCDEQSPADRKTQFLGLLLTTRDFNPLKNTATIAKTIYKILDMNGLFQGGKLSIFLKAHTKTLAPARTVDAGRVCFFPPHSPNQF